MESYDMPSADQDRFDRMKNHLMDFDFEAIRGVLEEVR